MKRGSNKNNHNTKSAANFKFQAINAHLAAGDEDCEHDGGGTDAEPFVADVAAEEGEDCVGPGVDAVEEVVPAQDVTIIQWGKGRHVLEGTEVEDGGVGIGV